MIIAASLCPWPPVLARELTGRDPVITELRKACAEATERLVGARPDLIVVVGPADETRRWDPGSRLDLSVFAPALGSGGNPALPPSLGLGALLLDQVGYRGPRILQGVSEYEGPAGCAELGAAIGGSAERVGLLVMGDGSARRSVQAPGYYDERAAAFDAETERALRHGDLGALLAISPALARELLATGRPAWQVMAGAMRPLPLAADILYSDAPFGVGYLVAFLTPQ
ncbi:MAG: class III extradiol dioxygenase subunit B-like domain-containing protein [Streptosporangiaceae bacterium]|nr:class III extradiol dioxygenase subunit B-like domain-containing protein [Streptosporangiaceae bacterium]